jgi:GT2 family glycosyltransferase
VVLLNWNGNGLAEQCLRDVMAQTYQPVQVVLADNGSTDGSADALAALCPRATLLRNETNVGYARGMNQGIAAAQGESLLLLNQDVLLAPDFLAQAVAVLQRDSSAGMVGGKVYRLVDGQKTEGVDNVGLFLRRTMALANSPNVTTEQAVFGPSGSCPLVRRAMLEDAALAPGQAFDEAYFAFGEDIDLWFRAHLRGWTCLYAPQAVAWHAHSGSLGGKIGLFDKPDLFQRHALKNRYLTIVKDVPAGLFLLLSPWLLVGELLQVGYVLLRRPGCLGNLLWAWREALRLFPAAWRQRRQIQARRKTDVASLWGFFKGGWGSPAGMKALI